MGGCWKRSGIIRDRAVEGIEPITYTLIVDVRIEVAVMGMSKLTLYADTKVVKRAKQWASRRNTSLSALVGRFLDAVTAKKDVGELPPITRRLSGIAKIPDRPLADLMADGLEQKYRLRK